MPCPEKFRESLIKFDVDASIIEQINTGFEQVVSSTPKKIKASYFKRAVDIMDEKVDAGKKRDILDWNACCKSGAREKASKAFARENKELPWKERLAKISEEDYMGTPVLNEDGTITVHAVYYRDGDKYACSCPNFNKLKRDYPVSKTYCFCCGGHFRFHYQIMLGLKLRVKEVVSSPLNSEGEMPCVFIMEIIG